MTANAADPHSAQPDLLGQFGGVEPEGGRADAAGTEFTAVSGPHAPAHRLPAGGGSSARGQLGLSR
ncbi:hypothetical protein [Umezawaea beigongshangensis]|uniref:hypothetical protein n=1 Tax=Umezawaea beigongshangensis TaxID=2780383 RepID=UPI0018F1973E|nr:hypothetical protein [Umezawaea beigongshangensis]